MSCTDGRKAVHYLFMDTKEYVRLKRLIDETDAEIATLKAEGYLKPDQLC